MGRLGDGCWKGKSPRAYDATQETINMLCRHFAVEEEVRRDSIQDGEECWLSNGVRGFISGRIKLG
jgi:hypothetical protein